MNQEIIKIYGYGDGFNSISELVKNIEDRKKQGIEDLSGAAVVWIKDQDNPEINKRMGVCIMTDGELNFAHAEYL